MQILSSFEWIFIYPKFNENSRQCYLRMLFKEKSFCLLNQFFFVNCVTKDIVYAIIK